MILKQNYVLLKNEEDDINDKINELIIKSKLHKKYSELKINEIKIEYLGYRTWALGWFNHYTIDLGQSDEEFLKSFERYVEMAIEKNEDAGFFKDSNFINDKNEVSPYTLMGAEDRFRWRSGEGDYDNPICRCDGCKKEGIVRIDH